MSRSDSAPQPRPQPLRVAIIGSGGVASGQHAPALAKIEGVELVAVCDVVADKANALAAKYGARAYTDYHLMLEEVQPNVVHVCTPEAFHFEPALAALEAGAHVFCEKVMTESAEKAWKLVKTALERDLLLAVDYNYRFFPVFRELKGIIDRGELGRIALINVYAHSYCMHHALDLIRFLGGEIVEVAAMHTRWHLPRGPLPLPVGDLVYCPTRNEGVVLRLANGAVATLAGSLHMHLKETMIQLECVGEKGRALIDEVNIANIAGRLRLYTTPDSEPKVTTYPSIAFSYAFERSIRAFIESVRERRAPSPSGIDGLRAVEYEEAVVRSQRERRFVPLPRVAASALAYSKLPLETALERIARLGIPYVDLAFHENWAHVNPSYVADNFDAALERVASALSRARIVPVSFNAGLGTNDLDEACRRLEAVARLARALSVRTITLPAPPTGSSLDEEAGRLERLAQAVASHDVQLTVETHVRQLTEDPETAAKLAERLSGAGINGVGLTLDPSHYFAGPAQGRGWEAVLPHVRHVHLRDAGASWSEIQMPVGQGRVPFREILAALRAHGYCGDFVAEYIDSIGNLDTGEEMLKLIRLAGEAWDRT